jgi:quaternary ammonium compound-resistance protein SugE
VAWLYLLIAGVFEVGWPLGFKLSQTTRFKWLFLSGLLLWIAQRHIPIGTAYAVWTGIGAAGTFLLGIAFFGDAVGLLRLLSFTLILTGIIGMKLTA